MTDYDDLRKLAEAATPGEWRNGIDDYYGGCVVKAVDGKRPVTGNVLFEDAAYIAAANPARVLALLDELEAYRRALEHIEKLADYPFATWDAEELRRLANIQGAAGDTLLNFNEDRPE